MAHHFIKTNNDVYCVSANIGFKGTQGQCFKIVKYLLLH